MKHINRLIKIRKKYLTFKSSNIQIKKIMARSIFFNLLHFLLGRIRFGQKIPDPSPDLVKKDRIRNPDRR